MSSPIEKTAVTVVTTPEIPSSTIPSPPTTSPSVPTGILGAGWEEIDAGPVAGRYRMAAVWTDHGLFVFGGHDNYSQESPSVEFYYGDGYLFDPESGWSALPEVGQELFQVGEPQALVMGEAVLVYGRPRAPLSNHAGVYDLAAQQWEQVVPDFGNELGPDTLLVWTGDLVVAPTLGLAYDPEDGYMSTIPVVPRDGDDAVHSAQRAHWTGSEVLVIGSGPAYAWAPNDDAWRKLSSPPIPDRARDSVWADRRLWVVNYQMAAAVLDVETEIWGRPGDLPLRFSECLPEVFAVGDMPVVRMCSGIALWDEVDHNWYPAPLEDLGIGRGGWNDLVGADDAIYSLGGPALHRFRIRRDDTGSIISPNTVPIGVMQLRVPSGWELVSSFAPEQPADGHIFQDTTIGLVFESGDTTCQVASTDIATGWVPPPDATLIGDIAVGPAGELPGTAYWVHGFEDDESGVLFAVPDSNGSDWVTIGCSSPDQDSLTGSASAFGFLWSPWDQPVAPWDQPVALPEVTTGPGWDALDAGPIEGRMRIAAAWIGEELFVWGGHDGYIQETPGPESFHQDAYLFDPVTESWRPAAATPGWLCAFTEAKVIPLDDEVLLRGLAPYRDDCAQAALYHPGEDSWRLVDSPLFDVMYFDTDLVWTGEWLVAPAAGLAWVPSENETIGLPSIADGASLGSRVDAHWTGDRIVALGGGDLYTLTPGEESWVSISGPPIQEGGRVSVWYSDGLWAADPDRGAGLLDRSLVLIDEQARWYRANLPLRNDECAVELFLAAERPVAATCVGMAIWDDFWVPIPAGETGWAWQPTLVGSDGAIYSIGEGFHRFPIALDSENRLADPATILIGAAFLDLGEFRISTTIGLSRGEYADGSIGEAIAVALDGPGGRCHVTSTYQGPPLGEPERVFASWPHSDPTTAASSGFLVLVFDSPNAMTDWAVRTGDGDVVRIHCESEDDALTLVQSLWGI
jgi:hypothetical protein